MKNNLSFLVVQYSDKKFKWKLTPRELEILVSRLQGDDLKMAADDLKLSRETIRFHSKNIFRKTRAENLGELCFLVFITYLNR